MKKINIRYIGEGGGGGMGMGSMVGAIIGAGQMVGGMMQKSEAMSMMPTEEDKQQVEYLNEIDRKRKSYYTGSAMQGAKTELNQNSVSAKNAITSTGSDSNSILKALSNVNKDSEKYFNNMLAFGEKQSMAQDTAYGTLLDSIAQRRLDIQMYKHARLLGEANENIAAGTDNLVGSAGAASGGGDAAGEGGEGGVSGGAIGSMIGGLMGMGE